MSKIYINKVKLAYFWEKIKSYINTTCAKKTELSTVATSGSYNDLTNKPDIPSSVLIASSFEYKSHTVTVTVDGYSSEIGTKDISLSGYKPLCIAGFNSIASGGDEEHSMCGAWLSTTR